MKDLTMGGFVMRTLDDIKNDIESTRERLHELYAEEQRVATKDIKLDDTKYYMFHDPDDDEITYYGKIYHYWMTRDGEYIFHVTGIQENITEISDSCWASFDACYQISVRSNKLDNFIKNIHEITEDEFEHRLFNWFHSIQKSLKYWFNLKDDEDE